MKNTIYKHFMMSACAALFLMMAPSSVQAQDAIDPCPMPEELAKQSPPDMATVQADIDILTLCVERARLLGEFDTLAEETRRGSGSPISGSSASSVVPNFEDDNFDLDEDALSDLPDEASINEILDEEGLADLGDKAQRTSKKKAVKYHMVKAINGSAETGIMATVISPEGDSVRVKAGDTLTDGSVVQSISALNGVVVSKQGTTKTLEWQ